MTQDLDPNLLEPPSALQSHLGYRLIAWSKDFARLELPLEPFLMNRQGLPHGGIHATMLDTAMGFSGCYTGDPARQQMALTLSLTVNYLGQANGKKLIAEARRTGGGKSTYFAEGMVWDDNGTLIATGTGVFRLRRDHTQ
ncbi:PaaI family thioesterase [uncultured Roseovarius sp.]|uniref:PaaI family thioesterase n=1 Tax=uncultured Roseovarius sp. TaxID=293344 RepID=UPI000C5F6D5C|nr:phenylacetic acid degradation protein [Roseovarius sp.]MBD12491.1 phenylacetic acid degradation protein [Roseovarius sp.]|tara:strand:- start:288 stop:707 length:420 start_codon:yes stop_codon:yes gene_type:complete